MNEHLLKNSGILAGLLLVINVVNLTIIDLFDLGRTSVSIIMITIGALLVGQIYVMNFKEMMPNKLRIHATLIYTLAQTVLSSLFFLIAEIQNLGLWGLMIGINLFSAIFIYWALGLSGKTYLNAIEKRDVVKK